MLKERVLHLGVEDAVDAFAGTKWKFFSYEGEEKGVVVAEIPRGSDESYILEFPFTTVEQRETTVSVLKKGEFIHQTVRIRSEW